VPLDELLPILRARVECVRDVLQDAVGHRLAIPIACCRPSTVNWPALTRSSPAFCVRQAGRRAEQQLVG
jgi:hypothetical protein